MHNGSSTCTSRSPGWVCLGFLVMAGCGVIYLIVPQSAVGSLVPGGGRGRLVVYESDVGHRLLVGS